MHALILSLALLLVPLVAGAGEAPLTGGEFEARTTGRTMTYAVDGKVYGTEQYLPGNRVIWAFEGDDCVRGTWEETAGRICFLYEDDPEPACWQFFDDGGRLTARFDGDPEGARLKEVAQSPEPMNCPGPEVGA